MKIYNMKKFLMLSLYYFLLFSMSDSRTLSFSFSISIEISKFYVNLIYQYIALFFTYILFYIRFQTYLHIEKRMFLSDFLFEKK